jgi:pimeloyl-ACP methyl ester carboxylesterase
MPAFLIHGVPDTAMLWDDVRKHLDRDDVIVPSMPGFSTPVPDGFNATKDAYAAWLIAQVEAVEEPVDIVGHDWGGILVQRLVSQRPDLVRTWVVGGGPLDTEYVWFQTAQMWQTLGAGENLMTALTPDAMTAVLSQQGLDAAYARAVGDLVDARMKTCILALYRSAIRVAEDWTPLAAPVPPGLVIWGGDDPYASVDYGRRLAERTGATFAPLDGCRHWWPHERAADVAVLLSQHWAGQM